MTFVTTDDTSEENVLDPQPGDPGHGDGGSPPNPPSFPAAPVRPRSWMAAIVAAAVLAGAGAGAGVSALMHDSSTKTVTVPAGASSNSSVIATPSDVQGILAKVGPAVAYVRTQAFSQGRFGFPSGGAGTGIVLTPDGQLLTNAHVVSGATSIKVTLGNDTQSHDATVMGVDTTHDLALVKINGVSNLPVAQLGNSSDLKVGDSVIAIGNALNLQGGMTVTEGIVSALNRSIDAGDGSGQGSESLSGLIQTDAAINPGNSGGPLLNSAGQVVGINTATSGDAQNIGFAIAIDNAKPVIDQLRKGGGSSSSPGSATQQASTAFLGVSVTDGDQGAQVVQVDPSSPAGRAGIQQGDDIVSLGGAQVQSADDLTSAMQSHKPGDKVTVKFVRGQDQQSATVQLASRQASSQ
jgi:putative serine protease PepD